MMWTHRKHGKKKFKGTYERDKKGERVFILTSVKPAIKRTSTKLMVHRRITFESWQAAKKLGWVRQREQ